MAQYLGKQSVFDEALGSYKDYGFSLKEPDDHIVELYFKDKKVATFYQEKLTIEILRENCKTFLVNTLREM